MTVIEDSQDFTREYYSIARGLESDSACLRPSSRTLQLDFFFKISFLETIFIACIGVILVYKIT